MMAEDRPRSVVARIVATLSLAIMGGCMTPKPSQLGHAADFTEISYEMNSWGRPLRSWSVNAQGAGTWTELVGRDGSPFGSADLVTHTVKASPADLDRLARTVSRLPDAAPDRTACRQRITDQPYGALFLRSRTGTSEYRYDAGCRDAEYVGYLNTLGEIDALVADWGQAGPVIRTEKLTRGR